MSSRSKLVIDEFVRVTDKDVVHQQIHVLGMDTTDSEFHASWLKRTHKQEMEELLTNVLKERVSNSKKIRKIKSQCKDDFTTPKIITGDVVRLAYSFRKNCQHHGLISRLNNTNGGYSMCDIFHEKLVVYAFHLKGFNEIRRETSSAQVQLPEKNGKTTSHYFDSVQCLDEGITRKKRITRATAKKSFVNTCEVTFGDYLSDKLAVPKEHLFNCDADNVIESCLFECQKEVVNNNTETPRNNETKTKYQMVIDQKDMSSQDDLNRTVSRLSPGVDITNTTSIRKKINLKILKGSVNTVRKQKQSKMLSETVDEFDACTSGKIGEHDSCSKSKACRVLRCKNKPISPNVYLEKALPYVDLSNSVRDIDFYKSDDLNSDIEPPRSPSPPPYTECLPYNSEDSIKVGDDKSDDRSVATVDVKNSPQEAVKLHPDVKNVNKRKDTCFPSSTKPMKMLKVCHNSRNTTKCVDDNIGDSDKSSKTVKQSKTNGKALPIKFRKSSKADCRRNSLNMDQLMHKYRHWPDNQLERAATPKIKKAVKMPHCSNNTVSDDRYEDIFEDCFIKEELSKPLCVKMEPNTVRDMLKEIGSFTDLQDLQDKHLTFLVHRNEKYLREIFQGKRPSRRHADYKTGGTVRANLNWQIPLGFYEEDQTDTIMEALRDLFCKKHNKYLDYLLRVMLPEILIKIYMDLNHTTYEETEELLEDY